MKKIVPDLDKFIFYINTYIIITEIFQSQVFLEPLQQLQCEGHLLHIDARSVFGNIEQLCSVSFNTY